MSKLKELVEELKTLLNKDTMYFRRDITNVVRKYDSSLHKEMASYATNSEKRRPRPTMEARVLREQNPGIYDVVFINRHNKEKQIMTIKKGIPYDIALAYYNYVTDYGTDKLTEHGHYEIVKREEIRLLEDDYLGL